MSFYSNKYGAHRRKKWKHYREYFENTEGLVLDLGCSTGNLLQWSPETTVGVDIDFDALTVARNRGLRVVLADLSAPLPFRDEAFAAVNCSAILEHLSDPLPTARRAVGALHPGGTLVVLVPNIARLGTRFWNDYTHKTPFTASGLKQLAAELPVDGFRVSAYPFHYLRAIPLRGSWWTSLSSRLESWIAALISRDLLLIAKKRQ